MHEPLRLLVADDEGTNRRLVTALFKSEGFQVAVAEGGREAVAQVASAPPSLVLLDLRMPDMSGLEALAAIRAIAPTLPVIVLTAYGDIPSAVEATRLGAYDFLIRPINNAQLVLAVRRAIERRSIEAELLALRSDAAAGDALLRLRGLGPSMQKVVERIRSVASSSLTVLLQGETGTGKEVMARALHQASARREKPFVALDCGAIPEALLESEVFGHEKGAFTGAGRRKDGQLKLAEGGTLFLDEVGNFNLAAQAKLLRVIQERVVLPLGAAHPVAIDVRLIAATNLPLEDQATQGNFRRDLYYRLAEYVIAVPPLRERKEDVLTLGRRFLEEASLELHRPASTLSPEAAAALVAHQWPGNVRELRNVIRQAALTATGVAIETQDLVLGEQRVAAPAVLPVALRGSLREIATAASASAERQAIAEALREAKGNKAEAARLLQTDYKTLYLKLKRYGLRSDEE